MTLVGHKNKGAMGRIMLGGLFDAMTMGHELKQSGQRREIRRKFYRAGPCIVHGPSSSGTDEVLLWGQLFSWGWLVEWVCCFVHSCLHSFIHSMGWVRGLGQQRQHHLD